MKKLFLPLVGLVLFGYPTKMAAQSSIKKCESSNYTIHGYLTNNSSTQPGMSIDYETNEIKNGDYGELSVYFEENLFGMITGGWLVIGEVEVTSKKNSQVSFKVIEKKSVITINNKEKNNFIQGKKVKFSSYEKASPKYHKEFFTGTSAIHSEGNMVCDTKTGYWKYYNQNGSTYREGNYDSLGKKEGLWKEYYDNRNLHFEFSYKRGELNGISKLYYESGVLSKQVNYKDGKEQGDYMVYFENGQLLEKGSYRDGKKNGVIFTYDSTGVLKYERTFEVGDKNGITKTYYPNGQLEQTGNYINNREDGQWFGYYPSGKVSFDFTYKNGELNGGVKEYYENGNLKFEGKRENGIAVGTDKAYYENGQVEYEEDVEIRNTVVYYSNGNLKEILFRDKEGLYDGPYSSFYENGKPKEDGHYETGQKVGKWKTWDEKGRKKMIKYSSDK